MESPRVSTEMPISKLSRAGDGKLWFLAQTRLPDFWESHVLLEYNHLFTYCLHCSHAKYQGCIRVETIWVTHKDGPFQKKFCQYLF